MVWTKSYVDKMVADKMVRAKWYGQKCYADKMLATKCYGQIVTDKQVRTKC